ncbi:hypothetical protein ACFU8W_31455 [Streptomyces sp. NPDC057565]|uniref:hypothetical protein n=1 Tax=Streptomyces sp. NPDC057565 TaxID=3346169 RepID=UPI0036B8BF76
MYTGPDRSDRAYTFSELPCPGLHPELDRCLAGVQERGLSVAVTGAYFAEIKKLLRFLAALDEPPSKLSSLQGWHLKQYRAESAGTRKSEEARARGLARLLRLLRLLRLRLRLRLRLLRYSPADSLSPDVLGMLVTPPSPRGPAAAILGAHA